jgi:hypothetical protein
VSKYSWDWWAGRANDFARAAKMNGTARSILPAIIGSGCVPYTLGTCAVFLDPNATRGRAVDCEAWRKVLAEGVLLEPAPDKPSFVDYSVGPVKTQSVW